MELDGLFSVRNFYWLGNFEAAIDESLTISPSNDRERIDLDVFVYRSYIGQRDYKKVLSSIGQDAGTDVLVVKMYADFLQNENKREEILNTFKDWLNDDTSGTNVTLQLMSGLAHFHVDDTKEALRSLRSNDNMEQLALKVQILLSMNRGDLAKKEIGIMEGLDDDSTLCQLSQARYMLAYGDMEKYQEAVYIYKDQMEKTVSSPMLLCGIAVANMQLKNFSEAEKYLLEAHSKDPKDVNIIANLIACSSNLNRPVSETQKLLKKLSALQPNSPIVSGVQSCLENFKRAAQTVK